MMVRSHDARPISRFSLSLSFARLRARYDFTSQKIERHARNRAKRRSMATADTRQQTYFFSRSPFLSRVRRGKLLVSFFNGRKKGFQKEINGGFPVFSLRACIMYTLLECRFILHL
jgi:hypothetical protein